MKNKNVVVVDFKAKKVVEHYTHWKHKCIVCLNDYEYDSRKHPSRPFLVQIDRKRFICKDCIQEMHDLIP